MEASGGESSKVADQPRQVKSETGYNIEEGVAAGILPSLLQPPTLDHTNPFLSPSTSPNFNVDEFLLSRAPGSSLSQISTDLQEYSINLKNQLNIVVDRDFKGFVSLGTALKAEGPRIARLDWKVVPSTSTSRISYEGGEQGSLTRREGEEEWNQKFETPRGSGGNLGLDKVRSEVVDVRDQLQKAEDDVRQVMKSKEEAATQKTNLLMLLSLSDSLRRLETLLVAPTDNNEDEGDSSGEEEGVDDPSAKYWQAFSKVEEYEDSDTDYHSSDDGEMSDFKHRQSTTMPALNTRKTTSKTQRRSSGLVSTRRRSSYGVNEVVAEGVINTPKMNTLDLPTRIARASSEYAALVFLRDRATAIGFNKFVVAHQERWIRVRELLKDDLRKLIRVLTRYEGSSLLVTPQERRNGKQDLYRSVEAAELESWSTNKLNSRERKNEQAAWLEAALTTWSTLPPTDSDKSTNGASEAEETIRAALVASWASKTITTDALTKRVPDPRTPKTPFGFREGEGFASLQVKYEVEEETLINLLSPSLIEESEDDFQAQALIHLYNEILTFVATQAKAVSEAAERVIAKISGQDLFNRQATQQSITSSTSFQSNTGQCDLFVRVLWDEIATRLMEQLGGQLFFAGRPEVFHRNYTISMAFLSAFESLAPSDRARTALHQHPSYQTFRKRWQLPVYFQIRLRDTITRLEKSLSSSSGTQFGSLPSHMIEHQQLLPLMIATGDALTLFASPWKRGTHINELMNRQWRLSLQVLARYKNWFEDELPSDIVLANRRGILDSAKVSNSRSSSDQVRTASPSRTATPTVIDPEADDALLTTFTILAADLIWLEKRVMEVFEGEIATLIGTKLGSDSVIETLRGTLETSLSMQTKFLPLLSTRICSILKSRCAEPLRLVRSVSTQYRAGSVTTNVTTTAEPSSFVVQFLRPIRQYLGKSDGKMEPRRVDVVVSRFLDEKIKSQWIMEVIEDFIARYAASLRTMNKNYESLRRLKRGNIAAGSTTSSTTAVSFGNFFNRSAGNTSNATPGKVEEDVEAKRMHNQMIIDVECLEREVQDLVTVNTHVQTDTLGWKQLKEAARGEQDE